LLGALIYEEPLRASVLAGQRLRLQDLGPGRVAERLNGILN
jgi:hypothetical protein